MVATVSFILATFLIFWDETFEPGPVILVPFAAFIALAWAPSRSNKCENPWK